MSPPPLDPPYPIPSNEKERLAALHALDILDTSPEPAIDRIAALAARLFDGPIGLVCLVDERRQWALGRGQEQLSVSNSRLN
jgi:hypothetical protein